MKHLEILLEYNEQRIINDFGQKLVDKYAKDVKKKHDASKIIKKTEQYDPTANKEYMHWIIGNYVRGSIQRYEDMYKARDALTKFQKLKITKKLPAENRDINRIKSLDELMDLIEPYSDEDVKSKNEIKDEVEEKLYRKKEAKLIYNDDEIKVVQLFTYEASLYFGKNTRWCTASKDDDYMFLDYIDTGELYVILIKKENKRYQAFYNTENSPSEFNLDSFGDSSDYFQLMDEKDKAVHSSRLVTAYPKLEEIFKPLSMSHHSFAFMINFTADDKKKIVTNIFRNEESVDDIDNDIYRLQSKKILPLDYDSDGVADTALKLLPDSLIYFKRVPEDIFIRCIKEMAENGNEDSIDIALERLSNKEKTDKIALTLIQISRTSNYDAFEELCDWPSQSPVLQKALIDEFEWEQIPRLVSSFKKPVSDEMLIYAIKKNPEVIKGLKTPSKDVQYAAVSQKIELIGFINKPDPAIQLFVVKEEPSYIRHIKNPSEIVQYYAVRQNPRCIKYISKPTAKIQKYVAGLEAHIQQYLDNSPLKKYQNL